MSRAALVGVVSIVLFALGGGQALGATIRWGEDTRRGPQVWLYAAAGERVDLAVHAEGGSALQPEDIVVENAAGALETTGTFPAPGACDPDEVECSVPCRIEAPNRARCSVYDGYSRPRQVIPLPGTYRSFYSGIWLFLSTADDRVTVPATNPVPFVLRSDETGGDKTFDLSRVMAGIQAGSGETITSGSGARVNAMLWGASNTFRAVNGRGDDVGCYSSTDAQTIRLDVHDRVGSCGGDIQPPPSPAGPVPSPLDAGDAALAIANLLVGEGRRCIEANLETPGSCVVP